MVNSTASIAGVNYKTRQKWFRYYRVAIQRWLNDEEDPEPLGGPGITVEIDETCCTKKRKYNRGSGGPRDDRWVFGIVERRNNGVRGRARAWLVPDRTRYSLIPLIRTNIHPESKIISDNYVVYHGLSEIGYDHEMVNHSLEFVERGNPNVHTETIEGTFLFYPVEVMTNNLQICYKLTTNFSPTGLWAHLKAHLNGRGGTRDHLIQERIDEWRFKRDYLRPDSHEYNFWKVLRVMQAQGYAAKVIVDNEDEAMEDDSDEEE